jgi:hypothetical protein
MLVTLTLIPVAAQTNNTVHWGKTWIDNSRFFVLNNAYAAPAGTSMSHYASTKDNWGGSWNFNGGTGGIGVAQLNYGRWPWGEWTTSSNLPVQVNSPTDVYSNWSFNQGTINGGWNAYYEIWIHSSSDIQTSNLTGDLMIHPDWDGTAVGPGNTSYGTYEGEVTLSGTQWYVHRQASYNGRPYDIIHYMRKDKTQSTGSLRLDDFWEHYTTKPWRVVPDHWVGSVTVAFEAFSGYGSYSTTGFNVDVRLPTAVNSAPVAVNDTATVRRNSSVTIAVLDNDSDNDGDTLSITSAQVVGRGTVSVQNGTLVYRPQRNSTGTERINYTISDGRGGTASASVVVTVTK